MKMLLSLLAAFVYCGATAHPLDIAYAQLQGLHATLDVHPNVAPSIKSLAATTLLSDVGPCTWENQREESFDQTARFTAQASCPQGWKELQWKFDFLPKLPSTYQVLGRAKLGEHEQVFTAQAINPQVRLSGNAAPGFSEFVAMGIEHIGAAPSEWRTPEGGWKLPDGIDHILFLLGLILGGGTLMQMLVTVTGFTIGHSITLALALLGWVRISPKIVEPAIALTIAFVAAESLFLSQRGKSRWKLAAFFGLIHGLGFASALGELHLESTWNFLRALVGYNVGIEAGQALLVAILAPVVLALRRRRFFLHYGLRLCSLGISGTGLYWFFLRAFG